jgi:hypothetical protein
LEEKEFEVRVKRGAFWGKMSNACGRIAAAKVRGIFDGNVLTIHRAKTSICAQLWKKPLTAPIFVETIMV